MVVNLLSNSTEAILQEAIRSELYASNLYRHLSNQCQRLGFFGAAKYFKAEAHSEIEHYEALANYLNDRGSVADMPAIEAIDEEVTGLESALSAAYDAEVDLGKNYSKWCLAAHSQDPTTAQFLLKYIEIQRVSIGEVSDWLQRVKLVGDDECGLIFIDKELGA